MTVLMPSLPPDNCRTTRMRFPLFGVTTLFVAAWSGEVPRAIAVRVMNDGARKPEVTSKAPRPRSERRVNAMALTQLVSGHGHRQVDEAAALQVDSGTIAWRQRTHVINERLARFRRRVAVDEQAEIEVDQRIWRADVLRGDLARDIGEVWLGGIAAHRQPIGPVEALEECGRVDPCRATLPAADVRWVQQILTHASQDLRDVGSNVLHVQGLE